jgi:hypothetical protein
MDIRKEQFRIANLLKASAALGADDLPHYLLTDPDQVTSAPPFWRVASFVGGVLVSIATRVLSILVPKPIFGPSPGYLWSLMVIGCAAAGSILFCLALYFQS